MSRLRAITADTIQTDRLALVPLRVEHAGQIARTLVDLRTFTPVGCAPDDLDAIRTHYERSATARLSGPLSLRTWAIQPYSEACLTGAVHALISRKERRAEIGWVVGTPWQGHGIATEAARGLIAWLHQQRMRTVVAAIHPDNHASQHVATAAGLTSTGRTSYHGEIMWEVL